MVSRHIRKIVEALSAKVLILPAKYQEPEIEISPAFRQQAQALQNQFQKGAINFVEYCSQLETLVQAEHDRQMGQGNG